MAPPPRWPPGSAAPTSKVSSSTSPNSARHDIASLVAIHGSSLSGRRPAGVGPSASGGPADRSVRGTGGHPALRPEAAPLVAIHGSSFERAMSWLRIRAVARRHAYVLQRAPQRWFDVVFWPVVDAILFGSLGVYFARASGGGQAAVGFLLAGILLFHVVFQAEISLATGFMEETWSRNLLNLLVTPLRETEYVAGVVLFGVVKLAMGVSVVAIVALGLF